MQSGQILDESVRTSLDSLLQCSRTRANTCCCGRRYLQVPPLTKRLSLVLLDSMCALVAIFRLQCNATHRHAVALQSSLPGWAPSVAADQFLQVDLRRWVQLHAIATQGHGQAQSWWVTRYKIKYSVDAAHFQWLQDGNGSAIEFQGNTDATSVVINPLPQCIPSVRAFQIHPVEWTVFPTLRVEAYELPLFCSGKTVPPKRNMPALAFS